MTDAALLDLMFMAKGADPPESVAVAADNLFTVFGDLIDAGIAAGRLRTRNPYRMKLLFVATMQGIASLVAARRINAEEGDGLIADSIALVTRGRRLA